MKQVLLIVGILGFLGLRADDSEIHYLKIQKIDPALYMEANPALTVPTIFHEGKYNRAIATRCMKNIQELAQKESKSLRWTTDYGPKDQQCGWVYMTDLFDDKYAGSNMQNGLGGMGMEESLSNNKDVNSCSVTCTHNGRIFKNELNAIHHDSEKQRCRCYRLPLTATKVYTLYSTKNNPSDTSYTRCPNVCASHQSIIPDLQGKSFVPVPDSKGNPVGGNDWCYCKVK